MLPCPLLHLRGRNYTDFKDKKTEAQGSCDLPVRLISEDMILNPRLALSPINSPQPPRPPLSYSFLTVASIFYTAAHNDFWFPEYPVVFLYLIILSLESESYIAEPLRGLNEEVQDAPRLVPVLQEKLS